MENMRTTPEENTYDAARADAESVPAAVSPTGKRRLNIGKLRNNDFVVAATAQRMDSREGAAFDVFVSRLHDADRPDDKAGDVL